MQHYFVQGRGGHTSGFPRPLHAAGHRRGSSFSASAMEYRPKNGPSYRPNGFAGGAHGNGNAGYGGAHGNGGDYAGDYSNGGTYAGGHGGNGVYGYGASDHGVYLPYGQGAAPGYCVGGGVGQSLAAAMPSTSHGQYGLGWGGNEHLRGLWAPPPVFLLPEAMRAAEAAANEVLLRLHPTVAAERRRQEVIAYTKRLIGTTFGCEVHVYGSVPLKTYLPDGDIDVTVLTNTPSESAFAEDLRDSLKSEANNADAQFVVKDVRIIHAKVKLVKCVIDNIVVDISFNKSGGVSTLCILEQADNQIGKEHLLKRSIILIKAWCYHEGNILGSSQWLFSTYALEILILYIFNHFHKSLHEPLEALYKFLDYYSRFDWKKHCLTLNGPVPLSSLCNSTEHAALNDELLLSNESLQSSVDRLIVLPIGSDRPGAKFCQKCVNIMDPLDVENNLGTSISDYNLKRIKEVFECGARDLGKILQLPSELIPDGIYGFFATTLAKHGRGERQDLGGSVSFHSVHDAGNGHGEDVSRLENDFVDENGNGSPDGLLLAEKESEVKPNMHHSSGLTNDFRSQSPSSSDSGDDITKHVGCHNGSATRVNKSNRTDDVSREKLQLPPFTPSNLLDLSGDPDLPLKCLRSFQYNLEADFHVLIQSAKKASLAGELDEDCFESSTVSSLSDTDERKSSTVKSSKVTRDVPQQSITEAQPLSGTHIPSSGSSLYPPAEVYYPPLYQNTQDIAYGAGMYTPDMNVSLPPRTDSLPNGSMFCPARPADNNNYPFASPYVPWDNPKRRGTGTYIPKTSLYDNKKQYQRQPDQVNGEKKPDRLNSCNGHVAVERALTNGEIKQVPTSEITGNSEQRYENGSMETPTLPPPRIMPPQHGGGGKGKLPVLSTGEPSPPAVKMDNSQSITTQQHENLQFGTMGPLSPTTLIPKFIEDFPALAVAKKPVQAGTSGAKSRLAEPTSSTVQSPTAEVSVTQSRPVEAQASTAQSPEPSESADECRSEESYKLKDNADFPPLQAGTRYKR